MPGLIMAGITMTSELQAGGGSPMESACSNASPLATRKAVRATAAHISDQAADAHHHHKTGRPVRGSICIIEAILRALVLLALAPKM